MILKEDLALFQNRNRFKLSILVSLIIAITSNCLAYDKLSSLFNSGEAVSSLLPVSQSFNGKAILLGGKANFPFTQTVNIDTQTKDIIIEIRSNSYSFIGRLDPSLRLQDSISTFRDKELIKFLGHDKRVTHFDSLRRKLIIDYYLNSKLKQTKEIGYDFATVDSDTLYLFLQAMLLKGTKDFSGQIVLNGKGLRLDMDFKLDTTNDLQSFTPQYSFPEKFKLITKQKDEVYVFTTTLTGAVNIVFPYKYYFAFSKTYPYKLIAYWGGKPQEAEYYFPNS